MLSRKGWRLLLFLPLLALLSLLGSIGPQATAQDSRPNLLAEQSADEKSPPPSGIFDFKDAYEPAEPSAERGLRAAEAQRDRGTTITDSAFHSCCAGAR